MIALEGVTVTFGRLHALRDVSLSAQDGAITGLVGLNGAGKTTALRVISGLQRLTAGTCHISIDGTPVAGADARACVGYLAEGAGLYPRLSALQNLCYFGRLHGLSRRQAEERARALARELGIEDLLSRSTEGFSLGERVKTLLARCLMHAPRHLLLDEPTNGLDVRAVRALRQHLDWLRSDAGGRHCIVLCSHSMYEIQALADHVVIMAHGRVVAQGNARELCAQAPAADLESAFMHFTEPARKEPV